MSYFNNLTPNTSFLFYQSECTNLHENNKENDALESEEFTEGVDEEVHEEECTLHQQHGPVPGQGQLHDGLMWNVMFCWSQLTISLHAALPLT